MSNNLTVVFSSFVVLSILILSIFFAVFHNKKLKETYKHLDSMLECALQNNFTESTYDETQLSRLEGKLNRFLTSSLVTKQNVEQEQHRVRALISDISHQTKTPIANILLYSQLLEETSSLNSEDRQLISQITLQSEKLNFLIQALVKTSRMEAGIISANPKPSSVHELLAKAIHAVKTKADEKQISLIYKGTEAFTAIFDCKWTEEAIYNILENGVKYTPSDGKITLSAILYEFFIRIDITDTGIGIEKSEINEIFHRFYRSPQVSQCEGVGIGLYLAREIISLQNGYIRVESTPGEGSTFSVFLPTEPKILQNR